MTETCRAHAMHELLAFFMNTRTHGNVPGSLAKRGCRLSCRRQRIWQKKNTKVACSMDVPQRRDILLINAFCWCNLGNVKWRCCNCAKDIKFGVTTLTPAQYGLFLCSTKACCDVGRTCIDDTDVYSCSSHATLTIMCAEKTACIQCKNRPRELCFQMRQEHFALNPPQVGLDCSVFGPEGYVNFAACIPE